MATPDLSVSTGGVNPQTAAGGSAAYWRSSNVVVPVVVGALVVLGGIAITASAPFFPKGTSSGIKIGAAGIGNVLTLVGTVLISWVIARAVSAREAKHEYKNDLDRVSQALGQIYGQLNNAVESAAAGSYASTETPFALIEQTSGAIRGLVTQIQSDIGRGFESEPIVTTKKALDELTSVLYSGEAVDRAKAGELVQEARVALARVQRTGALPLNVPEDVKCPSCGVGNSVLLGGDPGSTRFGVCSSCGSRFNVHRRGDGSLYVRLRSDGASDLVQARPASERSTVTLECVCGQEIVASFSDDGSGSKPIVCSHCGRCHQVSIPDGNVLSTLQFEIVAGEVIGFTNKSGQPVTRCPVCRATMRCAMRDRSRRLYFAYCLKDERLMQVGEADVEKARANGSG